MSSMRQHPADHHGYGYRADRRIVKFIVSRGSHRSDGLGYYAEQIWISKTLDEFGAGNLDILVGTQMITKGLDFGRVTVVGIWDGDRILNFPDFRSGERAFQQITQVAGRAGRREIQGKVIVQTRDPQIHLYEQVIKGDYDEFFTHEMHDRKKFYYPPYVKIVKITTRHSDPK